MLFCWEKGGRVFEYHVKRANRVGAWDNVAFFTDQSFSYVVSVEYNVQLNSPDYRQLTIVEHDTVNTRTTFSTR